MRTLLSALFGIVAVVLIPVAVTAAWMDQHVVSEQGFVELGAPLGEDEDFQSSLADSLGEYLSTQTGLPPELNALVEPVITETVRKVSTLPGYSDAWNESLRRTHQNVFSDQQGSDQLTLDIGPIVSLAVNSFSDAVGVDVDAPGSVPVEVGTGGEHEVVNQIQRVASVWVPIAVIAAVAVIAALLFARVRSTTLALLGLGTAIAGGVLWLLTENYRAFLPEQGGGSEIARLFRDSLLARAAESFSSWTLLLAAAGAVVFVVGILIRTIASRGAANSRGRVPVS